MKRSEKDTLARGPAAGTALIIIVLLIILGGILYWMYTVKLLLLPDSVSEFLGIGGGDTDDSVPWDTGELSGAVKNGKSDDRVDVTFDITYENLRAALLSEAEPEGIYQQVRISYYSDTKAVSHRVVIRKYGDYFRVEKYTGDSLAVLDTVAVADDTSVYYLNQASEEARTLPRGDNMSAETEAGFPSVDELLAVLADIPGISDITSETGETNYENESEEDVTEQTADYARYYDCELTMLTTDSGIVYYAAYSDRELGIREEYYISLEYRIIINQITSGAGGNIYSCETVSFSTESKNYADMSYYTPG